MVEKFDDFEGQNFLDKEGTFIFEVEDYELQPSKNGGYDNAVFTFKCDDGTIRQWHSLNPKARWTYNKLIKACMKDKTPKELDYSTFGNELIGKKFKADVELQCYDTEVKVPRDDGTYESKIVTKENLKVVSTSYEAV